MLGDPLRSPSETLSFQLQGLLWANNGLSHRKTARNAATKESFMRLLLSVLAIAIIFASSSAAQNPPMRKAGLWEIRVTFEAATVDGGAMPTLVSQQCTDETTEKLMDALGGGIAAQCERTVRKVAATIVIDAICQTGPIKSVSQSVISGDFDSNYTAKTTTKVEGLPKGWEPLWAVTVGPSTVQARWLGACKPNQRPGDIIAPDGSTTNVKELFKQLQNDPPG
jgi:hypothetical protein